MGANNSDENFKKSIDYNTIMLSIGFAGLFTVLSIVKDGIAFQTMAKISYYSLIALGLFISWEIFNMLISPLKAIFPKQIGSDEFKKLRVIFWFLIFSTVLFFLIRVAILLFPALYIYLTL